MLTSMSADVPSLMGGPPSSSVPRRPSLTSMLLMSASSYWMPGGGGDGDGGGGGGRGGGGDGLGGDGDGGGGGGECGERLGLGEWRRRVVVSKPNHVKRRLNKRSDPKCSDDDVRVCTHRWVTAARWRPKTHEENDRATMHRRHNREQNARTAARQSST